MAVALGSHLPLARGPPLPFEDQLNSSRHFQCELNRLGITSAIDAGGVGQNYPDDYLDLSRPLRNFYGAVHQAMYDGVSSGVSLAPGTDRPTVCTCTGEW